MTDGHFAVFADNFNEDKEIALVTSLRNFGLPNRASAQHSGTMNRLHGRHSHSDPRQV